MSQRDICSIDPSFWELPFITQYRILMKFIASCQPRQHLSCDWLTDLRRDYGESSVG